MPEKSANWRHTRPGEAGLPGSFAIRRRTQNRAPHSAFLVRLGFLGGVAAFVLVAGELSWNMTQKGHAITELPTAQAAPKTQAASALRMGPVSTGVTAVDNAARGFVAGNLEEAFAQLIRQKIACGSLPWGNRVVLPCLPGEAPGTAHEMTLFGCQPTWIPADAARTELAALLANTPGLYAVTRSGGDYRVALGWPDATDRSLVLIVSSLGVVSFGTECGLPLEPTAGRQIGFVTSSGH